MCTGARPAVGTTPCGTLATLHGFDHFEVRKVFGLLKLLTSRTGHVLQFCALPVRVRVNKRSVHILVKTSVHLLPSSM
jgi:hypothetical protein